MDASSDLDSPGAREAVMPSGGKGKRKKHVSIMVQCVPLFCSDFC